MNHTPFIWAAYGIGALVLTWCALAPLLRKKAAIKAILEMRRATNERRANHDADA